MNLNHKDINSNPVSTTPTGFKDGPVISSTPMAAASDVQKTTATPKLDVSKMFEQMGSKLGWFQYSDLDTALKTLSKSTKKKSSRQRRPQNDKNSVTYKAEGKLDRQMSSTNEDKKTIAKQNSSVTTNFKLNKHQKSLMPNGKENSGKIKSRKKSRQPDIPLAEKDLYDNEEKMELYNNEESVEVPLRHSKACTDLTKSPLQERKGSIRKDHKNALSLKKKWKDKKIKQNEKKSNHKDTEDSSSVSPELQENLKEHFEKVSANYNCRSSSESPEDFGIPARESTRIFSESGLGCGLNSVDLSRISLNNSKNLSGFSWVSDSNDDSYQQLNIHSVKTSVGKEDCGDVCLDMKSLHLDDSELLKKDKSRMSDIDKQDLYMTAVGSPSKIEHTDDVSPQNSHAGTQQYANQSKVIKMSSSSVSSLSSYEVVDVATQVDSDLEHVYIKNVKGDKSNNKSEKQVSSSESESSNNSRNYRLPQSARSASASNSSGSFCEVADVSLQTSIIQNYDLGVSPKLTFENENSFVEVQDLYIQTDGSQECRNTGPDKNLDFKENSKSPGNDEANSSNRIPTSCVDNDIMILDMQGEGKKFFKREPSIYFDAKDFSSESLEFKYKRRDPSLYFDAKQMLSDSSKSSESSSPVTLATGNINNSGFHNRSDKSIEIFEDDHTECDTKSEPVSHARNTSRPEVEKWQRQKAFSISSDSNDEIIDNKEQNGFSQTSKVSISSDDLPSSPAYPSYPSNPANLSSPDSPANLRSRLLSRKHSHKDQKQTKEPQSSSNHWRTKKQVDLDSSSDDDLESFFQKMRNLSSQNSKEKPEKPKSLDEFIVADDDVSSDSDDQGFYLSTNSSVYPKPPNKKLSPIKFKASDSEEDEVFKTPVITKKIKTKKPTHVPDNFGRVYKDSTPEYTYSFLKSLGENLPEHKCDADALRYKKTFKKNRETLTKKLFKLYNETVFDCELPDHLEILWNNRLLRTAGYCAYKRSAASDSGRSVRVELSTKVCDSAERVRDTLIHELCHAAVWLLNGKTDGHGPYWKYWARKSNLTHPEIPVIARCHDYSINTKYTYQCSKCGYRIGRHSKSLNTERKVCGYCHGTFILLQNQANKNKDVSQTPKTPRTPNKFALFVKENYGEVKRREKLPHKDVMKILGQEFAAKNKIFEG